MSTQNLKLIHFTSLLNLHYAARNTEIIDKYEQKLTQKYKEKNRKKLHTKVKS